MLSRPYNYTFSGSPVNSAAAVAAHQADRQAQGQIGAAQAQAMGAAQVARQNALGSLYQQPADAFTAYAGANTSGGNAYQQGMGSLANAQSGLYQNYNTALANLYGSQMSGMGTAEAARQIGLANLGSSALSAGGQASGAALGAWADSQGAFAKAMADAAAANQMATSQYGVGRDSALASLGTSASNYGTGLNRAWTDAQANMNNYSRDLNKLGVARDLGIGQLGIAGQVAGNMPATMSGLGQAVGGIGSAISGAIAQAGGVPADQPAPQPMPRYPTAPPARLPSYGWSPTQYNDQPGNLALTGLAQGADRTFGELASARRGVEDTSVLDALSANNAAARGQLDSAYYSSQGMPSQMLAQSLGGFDSMMRTAGRGMNYGMDQFYANMPRGFEDRMREGLQMGSRALSETGGRMGSAYRDMASRNQSGYSQFGQQLGDMMDRTGVMTDLQRQDQQLRMQGNSRQRSPSFRPRIVYPRARA